MRCETTVSVNSDNERLEDTQETVIRLNKTEAEELFSDLADLDPAREYEVTASIRAKLKKQVID